MLEALAMASVQYGASASTNITLDTFANATLNLLMPAITEKLASGDTLSYFAFDGHPDGYTAAVARIQRITNANVTVSGTQTLDVGLDSKRVFDWATADAFRAGADLVLVGFLYNGTLCPVVRGGTGQMWMWKLGTGRITTGTTLNETTGQLAMDSAKGSQGASPLAINDATNFAYIELANANYPLTDGLEFHVYWQPMIRKDASVNVPTATYSQSGTTLTITETAHGLRVGQLITFTPTSGSALSGTYAVQSITNANIFVVTASNSATNSGNCTVDPTGLNTNSRSECILSYGATATQNCINLEVGGNAQRFVRRFGQESVSGGSAGDQNITAGAIGASKQYASYISTLALNNTAFMLYEGATQVGSTVTLNANNITANSNLTQGNLRLFTRPSNMTGQPTTQANIIISGVIITKTLTDYKRASLTARWMSYTEQQDNISTTDLMAMLDDGFDFRSVSGGALTSMKGNTSIQFNTSTPVGNNVVATYSQSGTTLTVTSNAHGLTVGQPIRLTGTSGALVNGDYTVLTVATNSFTCNAPTSLSTSGGLTYINRPDWVFNDTVPYVGLTAPRSNKNSNRGNRATSWRQPSGDNYWCGYKQVRTAITISYFESTAVSDLVSLMAVATNDPLTYPVAGSGSPSDYNFFMGTHHAQPDGMTSANIAFDTGSITGVSGCGDNVAGGDKQPTLKYTQPLANESMQLPANALADFTVTYGQDPANYLAPINVTNGTSLTVSEVSRIFGKTSPAPEGDINAGALFNFPQTGNISLLSVFTVNNNSFAPNATLSARNQLYRKATAKLWTTPLVGAKIGSLDASYARFINKANVCQPATGAFLQSGAYLNTLKGSNIAVLLSSQEFTTKMALQFAIFAPIKLFGL